MSLIDDILANPTTLIAALALLVSITVSIASIIIGALGLWFQLKHNRLSVRPLGNIALVDSENEIAIAINNDGTGPMIIKSVETVDNQGVKKKYPFDWIPIEERKNVGFWKDFENASLINGWTPMLILHYILDPKKQIKFREEIGFD